MKCTKHVHTQGAHAVCPELAFLVSLPTLGTRDVKSLAKACLAAFFPLRCLPPSLDVFVYVISSSFSCPNIKYSLGLVVYTLIFSIVILGPTI